MPKTTKKASPKLLSKLAARLKKAYPGLMFAEACYLQVHDLEGREIAWIDDGNSDPSNELNVIGSGEDGFSLDDSDELAFGSYPDVEAAFARVEALIQRRIAACKAQLQGVIDRLVAHRTRFDELLEFVDKDRFTLQEKAKGREMLKALKSTLEEDAKFGGLMRNRDKINRYEDKHYYHAVSKASAILKCKVNSDPIKGRWHSNLYESRIDITYSLGNAEDAMKKLNEIV